MVTAAILGHRGMLGSVVARRWAELGADIVSEATADYVVNCIRPDDLILSERLAETARLIQPSTDAIGEDSDYARGKRILERIPGTVTIRAGLVDITRQPERAYRNWFCNPLTPLEWADLAWSVKDRPTVHSVGREPVSRFYVASLVADIFDRPHPVADWAEVPSDRVLDNYWTEWPLLADALTEYAAWLRS